MLRACVHPCVRRAASFCVAVRCAASCCVVRASCCVVMRRAASRRIVFLHCVFALQGVFTLRFRAARRFYTACLRCKVFLHCVFAMQGVFTLRFCNARRFYTALLRCKAFSHCVFCDVLRFPSAFLCYVAFLRCVFALCYVLAPCLWNVFTIHVFEVEESIADVPTQLLCLGDLENLGQLPVLEVFEVTQTG